MRLIGVGVGPGDPELLTLKALRTLREAGRIFVPVLPGEAPGRAEQTILTHIDGSRMERLPFALNERTDTARRERYWDAAGSRVAQWIEDTQGVAVFATIGDPNVYSTFSYLAQTVKALVPSVEVETVPGITAMQALAAAAGIPLAEGSEPLVLLPLAHGASTLDEVLQHEGTVVAYKGGRHVADVSARLKSAGRLERAVIGTHLGLPDERIAPLSDVDDAPYLSSILIPPLREHRGGRI